jgi:hypothetical protein
MEEVIIWVRILHTQLKMKRNQTTTTKSFRRLCENYMFEEDNNKESVTLRQIATIRGDINERRTKSSDHHHHNHLPVYQKEKKGRSL